MDTWASESRRLLVLAVSSCCLISVVGCSYQGAPRPTTGTVTGQVTEAGGPIGNKGGAVVNGWVSFYAIDGRLVGATRTDQHGQYSTRLSQGAYQVVFSPCHYGQGTTVTAGETTKLNLLCSML